MADDLTIRPFADGDTAAVLELMRAALGETPVLQRSTELFHWKHLDNPFGRSIMLLAEAGGRVAGFRAFMRWELGAPDGTALRCVRPVDTATHPDFQRRGIFRRLTEQAVEAAREDGVDLVFNTPNPASGAGYYKMGWSGVGKVGVLVRPSWRLLSGRLASPPLPRIGDFLDPAVAVPEGWTIPDRPGRGLRTPRTTAYLDWRFRRHPTAEYALVDTEGGEAIVRPNYRAGRRELVVSDVFGSRGDAAIRRAARAARAQYLAAWFSPGSPERRAATRAGLVPVPGVSALFLMARPLRPLAVDPTSMRSWDLALSDLELL